MRIHRAPWRVAALITMAFLVTGCDSLSGSNAALPAFAEQQTAMPNSASIRLEAGDKIRVTVFGEDKLSGEYQVDTGGFVALPLAGSVKAAGLTGPELERTLEQKFKSTYLRNPKVTVEVMTFRPFYVLGEVQKPGEYPYRTGLNVLSAIATAGGATFRANTSKVMIQRAGTKTLEEYPQAPSVLVYPGDLVRVPERYF
jgi:protein involved in polysaccharide export with SLBB domain